MKRSAANIFQRFGAKRFYSIAKSKTFTSKGLFTTLTLATTTAAAFYYLQQPKFVRAEEKHSFDEHKDDFRYEVKDNPLFETLRGKTKQDLDITLYQYQVCPFCCKVRAYLDFHKIPYKIVEVDPVFKKELADSDYKKVPQTIINGIRVNDSTLIISTLDQILNPQVKDPIHAANEKYWRKWVDHKFVHTIPPNIYRTQSEAIAAFEYISDMNQFGFLQKQAAKYLGSSVMYVVSKRLKTKYHIEDEREAIYSCGREWMKALGSKPFHGGNKPDLADLATYGVLTSIEGLQTFEDLFEHADMADWYYRMKSLVGSSTGKRMN
jgi:microsomal prostaglandin-E synthase 2